MHASPAEVSPPQREAVPPPPPQVRSSGPLRVPIIAGIAALIVLATIFAVFRRPGASHKSLPNATAPVGFAAATLRMTGTTEAVRMRAIVAPTLEGERFGNLTVTKLAENGARVRHGDILAEFDRQAQLRTFVDKQAEYQDFANKAAQEQAKEDAARAKDETEIGSAESALRKAELEMQKVELFSKIDAEKAEETLQEAKATLKQLRTTFDLKRQAAHAGIRLLEIQRDRSRQVMEHAQANAALMQIRSPLDGVVVLNSIWKGGKMGDVQEGDQIRAGMTFMQVVDPSRMQVRASVNQVDIPGLRIGLPARIHLDAYPELVFDGRIEEMAPIARTGDFSSKLRTFAVVFSIDGNNAKLMPDLSAAVDVNTVTQTADGGVAITAGARAR